MGDFAVDRASRLANAMFSAASITGALCALLVNTTGGLYPQITHVSVNWEGEAPLARGRKRPLRGLCLCTSLAFELVDFMNPEVSIQLGPVQENTLSSRRRGGVRYTFDNQNTHYVTSVYGPTIREETAVLLSTLFNLSMWLPIAFSKVDFRFATPAAYETATSKIPRTQLVEQSVGFSEQSGVDYPKTVIAVPFRGRIYHSAYAFDPNRPYPATVWTVSAPYSLDPVLFWLTRITGIQPSDHLFAMDNDGVSMEICVTENPPS
jgi:hypothetical protein